MNTIWLFLIILILFFAYLGQNGKKYPVLFRVLLTILLAYITGMGGVAAQDHAGYARMYNDAFTSFASMGEYTWSSIFRSGYAIESGYILLNVLCHLLGLGEAGFFFVVALFVNGTTIHHIYKYNLPMLSVIVLLFVSAFMSQQANLVRQFLALGVMMYFIDFLSAKKDWWKYLLGVILAAQFHTSAFFFILFLPVCFVLTDKSKMVVRVILTSLLLVSILTGIGLLPFNILGFFDFITAYEARFTEANTVDSIMNIIPALIVTIPALIILFNNRLYNRSLLFIIFITVAAIFANLGFAYPNLRRMYWYFEPLAYIFMVQYLDLKLYANESDKSVTTAVKFAFIGMSMFFMLRNFVFNPNQLLLSQPYDWNQLFI